MTFRTVLVACMAFLLFSCSKDKSVEKPVNHPSDSTSYQPVSSGSSWHYKDGINLNGGYTLTATGKDTTINGISFYIFENKPDTSDMTAETYFGQNRNNYYALGFMTQLGNNAMLYLKDTSKVNTTWTQNIPISLQGISLSAEMDFQLLQVSGTRVVNSKTYQNVAHVGLQVKVPNPLGGSAISYLTGDLYFARGVGIIEMTIQQGGSAVTDISLDTYTIK